MQLKQFISETLIQIADGVSEAKPHFEELGGTVNPREFDEVTGEVISAKYRSGRNNIRLLCNVQFEVALTSDNSTEGKAGIGVFWGEIGIGAKNAESARDVSFNKVKFNVPIQLP